MSYLPARRAQAGGDYVEQLTYLLFLKMADERTQPPCLPAFLPVRDKTQTGGAGKSKSIVPKKYGWPSQMKKDGNELFDHYQKFRIV